jgi:hypothetical protein
LIQLTAAAITAGVPPLPLQQRIDRSLVLAANSAKLGFRFGVIGIEFLD